MTLEEAKNTLTSFNLWVIRANGKLAPVSEAIIKVLAELDRQEEQEKLDIKALKHDLPELFKPHYDGGYLKEGEEE